MSFGAISRPAVLALSKGARTAGCWMNTGEGGLSPYHLEGGGDIVFQIGTATYGVRDDNGGLDDGKLREVAAHPQVRMFEIKLSQGAKPGKGGILPAAKVTAEIAAIRGIPLGQDSLSPSRHPEIDSTGDLLDFVNRVRRIADPNLATDAVYTPAGGDPLTVRVIARQPDEIVGFGDTRIHTETAIFDVRISEVPTPAESDTLEIGGDTYVIQGEPVRDRDGLLWTLDVRPA
jgi:hypothetical protein